MIDVRFDMKVIDELKNILLQLRNDTHVPSVITQFEPFFSMHRDVTIRLLLIELLSSDDVITVEDVRRFIHVFYRFLQVNELDRFKPDHPINVLMEENRKLENVLEQIDFIVHILEDEFPNCGDEIITIFQKETELLGSFQNHYHRKQKLYFPILERYGYYTPSKFIWQKDDRICALYKGFRTLVDTLPEGEVESIRITFNSFENQFNEMIFLEEQLLLPIFISLFNTEDWDAIAMESDAFGYTFIQKQDQSLRYQALHHAVENKQDTPTRNFPFGTGYLTLEEANIILNNLPLEITFVDKNSIFKYFNNITKASDMMFIRTPTSIGRNVAHCHPPKSLKKVMQLIRDLKTKKRTEETMWFKKGDEFLHITYKALFNEDNEFFGILEYVQDIQPFFELPDDMKTALSDIEE